MKSVIGWQAKFEVSPKQSDIRLKTNKKKIWFNCLRDVNASEYLDCSFWKQMICKGSFHDFMRDLHDFA